MIKECIIIMIHKIKMELKGAWLNVLFYSIWVEL